MKRTKPLNLLLKRIGLRFFPLLIDPVVIWLKNQEVFCILIPSFLKSASVIQQMQGAALLIKVFTRIFWRQI